MTNTTKGFMFVITCIILWAFIPVVSRFGQVNLDNFQFLFWSSLFSCIVLSFSTIASKGFHEFKKYSIKDVFIALGLGFLGAFLYYLLLYFAYANAKGLEVLVLQYTWPIFIVIFSIPFLHEKISKKIMLSIFLGFLGVLVVLTKGNLTSLYFDNLYVDILVIFAAASFGIFSVLSKKFNFEAFSANTLFFLSATIFSFIAMIIFSKFTIPSMSSFVPVIVNGTLINGFSYVLWVKGLSYLKATTIAPLIFLTPVIAAFLIILFFKESFMLVYAIGLLLVLSAGLLSK